MTLQYKDIETTIVSYLSALMNDKLRTVRFITHMVSNQFPGTTRTMISEVLYDSDKFIPHSKPNDNIVYWFLNYHNIEEMLASPKPEGRIYVFVDCDNSSDLACFLSDDVMRYDTLFIRGYGSADYTMRDEESVEYIHTLDDHDMFYESKSVEEENNPDSVDIVLLSDLKSVLQTHYDSTCFVVSTNKALTDSVNALQYQFIESDLHTGVDSEVIRNMIVSCI